MGGEEKTSEARRKDALAISSRQIINGMRRGHVMTTSTAFCRVGGTTQYVCTQTVSIAIHL